MIIIPENPVKMFDQEVEEIEEEYRRQAQILAGSSSSSSSSLQMKNVNWEREIELQQIEFMEKLEAQWKEEEDHRQWDEEELNAMEKVEQENYITEQEQIQQSIMEESESMFEENQVVVNSRRYPEELVVELTELEMEDIRLCIELNPEEFGIKPSSIEKNANMVEAEAEGNIKEIQRDNEHLEMHLKKDINMKNEDEELIISTTPNYPPPPLTMHYVVEEATTEISNENADETTIITATDTIIRHSKKAKRVSYPPFSSEGLSTRSKQTLPRQMVTRRSSKQFSSSRKT